MNTKNISWGVKAAGA